MKGTIKKLLITMCTLTICTTIILVGVDYNKGDYNKGERNLDSEPTVTTTTINVSKATEAVKTTEKKDDNLTKKDVTIVNTTNKVTYTDKTTIVNNESIKNNIGETNKTKKTNKNKKDDKEPNLVSLGNFKLTAYCNGSCCCGQWAGGATASGTMPKAGRTIAVDTSIIPFGTKVVINGHTYVAEDTGGAIRGNRIDIYFDNHQSAMNFGTQYTEVFKVA